MSGAEDFRSQRVDRAEFLRLGGIGLAGTVLLGTTGGAALARTEHSLRAAFVAASREYGVPVELLLAMGFVNTGWEMPSPEASPYEPGDVHGRGAYGVMQLLQNPSTDTLGRAASLTGLSKRRLKTHPPSNIRGAAAVLADIAGERPSGLNGWFDVVAEYGGGALYANEVYEALRGGASTETSTGERLRLSPQESAETQAFSAQRAAAGQYPGSTWYGASSTSRNYTPASRPPTINRIIVHTMQGTYSGTINWFKDPASSASYHYNVSRRGEVGQSVREDDIAWHAGWWDYNRTSIGIGHAGYIGNPDFWYTEAMYNASARLAAHLVNKYRIPLDRYHIIGHYQVPGCKGGSGGGVSCHTDPGRGWNWTKYMGRIAYYRSRV